MHDPSQEGPFICMAVFCEMVLEEKTGVLSIMRIIDRINISAGAEAPENMPPFPLNLKAVVALKAGFLKGKYTVTVKPITPSGRELPEVKLPVLFEGDERGANLILKIALQVQEEGLYWFEVSIEGHQLLTRMPLRILYQRMGGVSRTP